MSYESDIAAMNALAVPDNGVRATGLRTHERTLLSGAKAMAGRLGSGGVVRSGNGAPSSNDGNNGDFYINLTTSTLYGPKTAGAWGSGVSLVGPAGDVTAATAAAQAAQASAATAEGAATTAQAAAESAESTAAATASSLSSLTADLAHLLPPIGSAALPAWVRGLRAYSPECPIISALGAGATPTFSTSFNYQESATSGAPNTTLYTFSRSVPTVGSGYPANSTVWASPTAMDTQDMFEWGMSVEFWWTGTVFSTRHVFAGNCRIYIDGLPVSDGEAADGSNFGNVWGFQYQFAIRRRRLVRIVCPAYGANFGGAFFESDAVLEKFTRPTRKRVLVIGDSFVEGSNASNVGAGMLDHLEYWTGWDIWRNGCGGTGFTVAGSVPRYSYADRIASVVAASSPDVVVLVGSTNDGSNDIGSAADACIAAIRSANSSAQILLVGPFANGNPSSSTIATQTTYLQAAATRNSVTFAASASVWSNGAIWPVIASPDGLHPNDFGHAYYGYLLAQLLMRAVS